MTKVFARTTVDKAELDARAVRVTHRMQSRGVRGLIVYSDGGNAGNTRYLTNYRPFFGMAIVVLREDGERILINTFNWDAPRGRAASGLENVLSGFDAAALVEDALRRLGVGPDAPLGLVGSSLIPFELYSALFSPDGRVPPVNMNMSYEALRLTKSALEQNMLRQACAITDEALKAMFENAAPGMSEQELAAFVDYEMKRRGADGVAFPASVASGPNTEKPVSLPTSRQLQSGDVVMVDVGATWEGYCADVTRTFVVGEPSARVRELHQAVSGALDCAIGAVRPGVPANRLHEVAVDKLRRAGIDAYFTHRVGHGIGLETSLEGPDLQRHDIPLEPGMTFCIEPGVYVPGVGGIKIEDDVIVGSEGAEVISKAPRELLSI